MIINIATGTEAEYAYRIDLIEVSHLGEFVHAWIQMGFDNRSLSLPVTPGRNVTSALCEANNWIAEQIKPADDRRIDLDIVATESGEPKIKEASFFARDSDGTLWGYRSRPMKYYIGDDEFESISERDVEFPISKNQCVHVDDLPAEFVQIIHLHFSYYARDEDGTLWGYLDKPHIGYAGPMAWVPTNGPLNAPSLSWIEPGQCVNLDGEIVG